MPMAVIEEAPDGAAALGALEKAMAGIRSAVVAVSGGVDSAVVLAAAARVIPTVVAATGTSAAYAESDMRAAVDIARQVGVPHVAVATRETSDPRYAVNAPTRCFHCKTELYGCLASLAAERGLETILDGTHAGDASDFRPGTRAGAERGVRSPLREAGLAKPEVRAIARHLGLPIWDKPASPCLASRFPYGEVITVEKLGMVDRAEAFLRGRGLRELRVRHHGNLARIEVAPADMARVLELAPQISAALHEIGYAFVTLDLRGFRTGALNEVLTPEDKSRALAGR